MREDSGSDLPAISDAFMIQAVSQTDKEVLRAYRRGGGSTPVERGLETGYTLAADAAVNNAAGVLTTDVTIMVDSTAGFPTAGAAVFWDTDMPDQFYYTGLTATSFTGVTQIGFTHPDDTAIQALYPLPSNFGNFRPSEDYGDGVQLNGETLRYMDFPPKFGYFSYIDDGTTKYLWLYRGSSSASGSASVLFDKSSNSILLTTDLVSAPDDWLDFYVWRSIQYALFGRGDYDIIKQAKDNADTLRLELLKDRNTGKMVRVRKFQRFDHENYELALRENAL